MIQRNYLINDIQQTAQPNEIARLIETMVCVRESRIKLLQEAFCREIPSKNATLLVTNFGYLPSHQSNVLG